MSSRYDAATKLADTGASVSVISWLTSLQVANEVVQIIAGIVAILAGMMAAIFHWKRIKALSSEAVGQEE